MTQTLGIDRDGYSHDLLVHDTDEELVRATQDFVAQGLDSGGQVLVHSSHERVALLRDALEPHPRLTYGYDEDLYRSPTTTLFAYQRQLALAPRPAQVWVTGTVPLAESRATQAAWSRYESLVNVALGGFAFHALCTYDARTLPGHVVDAARAAHPHQGVGSLRRENPDYETPGDFLANPLAVTPQVPATSPTADLVLRDLRELHLARSLVAREAKTSGLPFDARVDFVSATHEVLANAFRHGAPPVLLELWVAAGRLTALVTDRGPGLPDTMSGFGYPDRGGSVGLWAARQMCEELVIRTGPDGGCSVLLAAG
ncbi:MAG: MEDS domain-containing protein [Oryzihumus sp.]